MFRLGKISLGILFLLLSGCGQKEEISIVLEDDLKTVESAEVGLPVEGYFERVTLKPFGKFVNDRFYGYHAADDIEFTDSAEVEIPVLAIGDGVVVRAAWIGGYGGQMIIEHSVDGRTIHAMYGHLDLASGSVAVGDRVSQGQFLANLGDGESEETDGERKHLHFALYEADEIRLAGYVQSESELAEWISPSEFFTSYGLSD